MYEDKEDLLMLLNTQSVKHGGGSVMAWARLSAYGTGSIGFLFILVLFCECNS